MKGENIGELEELVLLIVGVKYDDQAYAITIQHALKTEAGRSADVTAIHSVLRRLEKKGLVKSYLGGATAERGGRRKRFFTLTRAGRIVLDDLMLVRSTLYNKLPQLSISGFPI